eukprot:TRINITY_DN17113_c0_g1_i5.p1 TRINITY_DN17113_c0_g1~~TRINITY_DN17113_c0_g1_i5.p1  ORF type:complete len:100 (-),score=0.27 TRINITY_DN17113_c0_g1_i5:174-473(-)
MDVSVGCPKYRWFQFSSIVYVIQMQICICIQIAQRFMKDQGLISWFLWELTLEISCGALDLQFFHSRRFSTRDLSFAYVPRYYSYSGNYLCHNALVAIL